jgi:ABC-type transporter Mla MlaB component
MSDLTISHTLSGDGTLLEVALAGRLAIDTAPELLMLLRTQLPTAHRTKLDVASLTEVDLSGMQLICSACRTAQEKGHSFNFSESPAPCVQEAIGVIGLQRHTTCKHNTQNPCLWCGGLN